MVLLTLKMEVTNMDWAYVFEPDYPVYIGKSTKPGDTILHKQCTFVYNVTRREYWFIPFISPFYTIWIKQYALNAYIGGI